jgi:hypothetical protein
MKNFSITEIAKIIGKSRQFVWLQIISNNLKAEKVGNYYAITESDFNAFFESYTNNTISYNNEGNKNG